MLKGAGCGFDELEVDLPNGLHDAEVESLTYDLFGKMLSLRLLVWVGTMADPPELRERYRRGTLLLKEVSSFAKSTPYDLSDAGLTILGCAQNKDLEAKFRAGAPSTDNGYRIFTGNSEFDIEAAHCEFKWNGEEEINRDTALPGE